MLVTCPNVRERTLPPLTAPVGENVKVCACHWCPIVLCKVRKEENCNNPPNKRNILRYTAPTTSWRLVVGCRLTGHAYRLQICIWNKGRSVCVTFKRSPIWIIAIYIMLPNILKIKLYNLVLDVKFNCNSLKDTIIIYLYVWIYYLRCGALLWHVFGMYCLATAFNNTQ